MLSLLKVRLFPRCACSDMLASRVEHPSTTLTPECYDAGFHRYNMGSNEEAANLSHVASRHIKLCGQSGWFKHTMVYYLKCVLYLGVIMIWRLGLAWCQVNQLRGRLARALFYFIVVLSKMKSPALFRAQYSRAFRCCTEGCTRVIFLGCTTALAILLFIITPESRKLFCNFINRRPMKGLGHRCHTGHPTLLLPLPPAAAAAAARVVQMHPPLLPRLLPLATQNPSSPGMLSR